MSWFAGFRAHRFEWGDRFFRLAAVNIVSNLMVPLAGLIDVAFLGHLDDIRHLAGVTLAAVVFNYLYWSFGFLRMGTTGMTAQATGREDVDAVWLTVLRHGAIALIAGCVLVLAQQPIREVAFALLSATEEVKQSGQAYYTAQIWGAPAALLDFVLVGWFLGRGQGRNVLLLSAVSNSVNIALNYWLIVRLGWESAGAGAATALSQVAMLLTGLALMLREVDWGHMRRLAPHLLDAAALRHIFSLNGNITIRTFALVSTFAVFTNLSAALGTVTLAANTLLLQVVTLAAYFIDGLAFATESFAGMFYGRGDRDQLAALTKLAGMTSIAIGLAIALMFALFPQPLFGLLTRHQSVIVELRQYVWWLVPVLAWGAIAYMLDGYFLGLTAGATLRTAALQSSLLGFGPVAIAAYYSQNPQWLWLALTSFMAARSLTLLRKLPSTLQVRE
ncbi:guanitoxin biosynthesis MATE family efflux transporter GntT [Leptolyngbya sp. AN02str]|uniref:guanitoxin biosynthesis MATE family efflux transporter GntT n=1 Tax=Leptolyngbya sp. AN02str TaxID=3423363 RepID=UPI003D319ADA